MKVSYKTLKRYIKNIKSGEEVAQDLVMHTSEVEEILKEGENLENVVIGEVIECEKHPDSEKLNCTKVKINSEVFPIVCGASNMRKGLIVPVALVGAKLKEDFVIQKTKIRGETSQGMICSEDELGLKTEKQVGIWELPKNAPIGTSMRDYLKLNDEILVIDNKAINHRPDMFSHIGVIREIYAINGENFDYKYSEIDFSKLPSLNIKNKIPKEVKRYIGLKVENVANIESPDYIKEVVISAGNQSKGLLIDISNYSLYFYGQPTHCFDADKIEGKITIRKAKNDEKFLALDKKEYSLSSEDIVIADDKKVLALGGVIGGLESSVDNNTKNIIIEGAHFDQAIIRKTGKRLGVRTDSLNVFEKDLVLDMPIKAVSLIVEELKKNIGKEVLPVAFSDLYENKQKIKEINFDLNFINNLIGREYERNYALKILENLGIKFDEKKSKLIIPFWRKDLNTEADIAEEIARIDGYDKVEATVPKINVGAVIQDNMVKIKNDSRNFFTDRGFFDMYNYSFVNEELMKKLNSGTDHLVKLKNALSEELTHMKGGLIPNLMLSLEKNIREFKNLKLFEIEKVFARTKGKDIVENYELAGVIISDKDLVYYEIQNIVSDFLKTIGVYNFSFDKMDLVPTYAHRGRTSGLIIRNYVVGYVGEIHPKTAKNFDIEKRIGFFELNVDKIKEIAYQKVKAKEISSFQENNFDLSFVVDKNLKGKDLYQTILKTSNLITKVDLFDIYENKEKLPGKRSLSFKIFIQSLTETLDDKIKNDLIKEIISKVEKIGGSLR